MRSGASYLSTTAQRLARSKTTLRARAGPKTEEAALSKKTARRRVRRPRRTHFHAAPPARHTPTALQAPPPASAGEGTRRGTVPRTGNTMTSLSAGAVEGIVNEIVTSDGGDRPVLQVAKFQPVGGANATRHKLWLTDGSRWVYAMAATQVHALLQEGGDFAPGCLVRLLKYSVNDMAGRKIVIVIDLEVAAGPQKLIGAPTGYPNGEALPSDAQPAGGGAPVPQAAKKPTPAPARAAPRRPSAGG